MNKIIVRYIEMPMTIKGTTVTDSDGNYNIYINSRLDIFARQRAYKHEINHLKNNDFYNGVDIESAEYRADSETY